MGAEIGQYEPLNKNIMRTRLAQLFWMNSLAALTLTACFSGDSRLDMSSDEAVAKVKELVQAQVNLDENKIYHLEWSENGQERKLENELSQIYYCYVNKDGRSYYQIISLENGEFQVQEPRLEKRTISYEQTTALPLDSITPAYVQRMTAEGQKLVSSMDEGSQYEFKSAEFYRFTIDPVYEDYVLQVASRKAPKIDRDNRTMSFAMNLNYIKKGEQGEVRGKHVWTNYYSVSFKLDDNGKLMLDDF